MKDVMLRNRRRFALAAAFAFGAFALAACDSAEDRLAKHLESGQELVAEGSMEKATVEFRNALALDANSVPAHLGMAAVYEQQKNYPAMIAHLTKVTEVDAVNVTALVKTGQLMMLGGQLDQAMENATMAVDAAPKNAEALTLKAGISLRLGNAEAAVELAQRAIAIEPDNPTAHAVLIGERIQADDNAGALEIANDITERVPQDLGVALVKLQVIEKQGDEEATGAYLKQLVDRFPDQMALRNALARWYFQRNDLAGAEAQMRAIAEANPDDPAPALRVAQFLLTTKGPEAGRAELQRLLDEAADKTPYQIAIAQFDFDTGETGEGRALLQTVIADALVAEKGAVANEVRLILARQDLKEDDREAARALAQSVLDTDAANADALAIRAALAYDSGDYNAALLDLRAALSSTPDNPQLLLLSARTHMKSGNTDLAGERYASAMQASDYAPELTIEYLNFLKLNQRGASVITVLNEATRRHPQDERLLKELAAAQIAGGDWVGADQTAAQLAAVDLDASRRIQAATLSGRERYDESLNVLGELAKEPEQRDSALAAMVQVYIRAGKTDEALEFLDGVLTENPENIQGLVLRAALRANAGDPTAAEADLRAAKAVDETATAPQLGLARLLFAQGRTEDALASAKEGAEIASNPAALRLLLGGYYETQGRYAEAIEQYRALYVAQPGSLVAANNLASLLVEHQADDPAAVADAAKIAEVLRGVEVPAFQDTFGWVQHIVGDDELALRYLTPAADALGDNPYVRFHIGATMVSLGDPVAARPHLEAAVAAGGENFSRHDEAKAMLDALPAVQ
ncbi:MAG: tetratricopeptide repeat protein [Paracoccaceae bacterium]